MRLNTFKCDLCGLSNLPVKEMAELTLEMSDDYKKHGNKKGMFVSPNEWDLCQGCFEKITDMIKGLLKGEKHE